ncbi:MAG: hypothetical protein ACE5J3_03810, partial [Methanosarcinales archaeon]
MKTRQLLDKLKKINPPNKEFNEKQEIEKHYSILEIDVILWLAVFGILLFKFGFILLEFIYILIIPGLCILFINGGDIKKFLPFSIPLSILLVHWSYFAFSRIGLHITHKYFLFVPFLMLIVTIFYLRKIGSEVKIKFYMPKYESKEIISFLCSLGTILLFICLIFYIYAPYFFKDAVATSGGSSQLFDNYKTVQGIKENNYVPFWMKEWYCGGPFLYHYSPVSSLIVASMKLFTDQPLYIVHHKLLVFFVLLIGYYSFCFSRYLGLRDISSAFATFLSVSFPYVVWQGCNGHMRNLMMVSFVILSIFAVFLIYKEGRLKNIPIYATAFFALTATHFFNIYTLSLPLLVLTALILIIDRKEPYTKKMMMNLVLAVLIFLLFISCWTIPFMSYWSEFSPATEGSWNVPASSLKVILDTIAAPPVNLNSPESFKVSKNTFTPVLFYGSILLALIPFSDLNIRKKKAKLSRERIYINILFFLLLFFIVCEIFSWHKYIPFRYVFYGAGYQYATLVFFISYNWAFLADTIAKNIDETKFVNLIVIGLMLFPFINVINYSKDLNNNYLVERAFIEKKLFAPIYDVMERIMDEDGRFAIFGSYGPAIISAACRWTGKSAYAGYSFQGHSTKLFYDNNIQNVFIESNDYPAPETKKNGLIAYNLFIKSNVQAIVYIGIVDSNGKWTFKGGEGYRATYFKYPDLYYNIVRYPDVEKPFLAIVSPKPRPSYAEQVFITDIISDSKERTIRLIMNTTQG